MKISVLTPTYNRKYCLNNLYKSLLRQTNKNFEWVIVDDGSNDGTYDYIKDITSNSPFAIKIQKQDNSGKGSALNLGYSLCDCEWIFIVDSDDELTDDAIEVLAVDLVLNPSQNAVAYRRRYKNGKVIGNFPIKFSQISTNPTIATKLFQGDLAFVIKKNILEKFKFPVYPDEKFVPEQYVWNKISDLNGILYFCNKTIYITEYLCDGYTNNFIENLKKNPKGFLLFYKNQILRTKNLYDIAKYFIRILQCYYTLLSKK